MDRRGVKFGLVVFICQIIFLLLFALLATYDVTAQPKPDKHSTPMLPQYYPSEYWSQFVASFIRHIVISLSADHNSLLVYTSHYYLVENWSQFVASFTHHIIISLSTDHNSLLVLYVTLLRPQ